MSRAKTVEEVREEFIAHIRSIAAYWAKAPNADTREMCDGVAFSILNVFDGTSGSMPAFDIIVRPHPEGKQFSIDNGDNYYEDGMVINECQLHEMYFG